MAKLHIVMYHYVRELRHSRYPDIKGLDYKLFKEQIGFFSENFQVVTMEEVIAYYREGYQLPKNALLLTFDDGYMDNFTFVLPVLSEYRMQGSFFVPGKVFREHCLLDVNKIHFLLACRPVEVLCKALSEQLDYYRGKIWDYPSNEELFDEYAVANRFDTKETIFFKRILQAVLPEELRSLISSNLFKKFVDVSEEVLARELYLNYDQMKCMKRQGMHFGIHGYGHYWMNRLEADSLKKDVEQALESMDGLVDQNQWVINYPYGSYSDKVVDMLKGSKCVLGLSTDVRIADLEKDHRYILPRLDANDYPPKSNNYRNF